jgi:type II secretory pathway pseudopilin PulG
MRTRVAKTQIDLKDQSGFTILEIVVTAGVLAIAMLGLMQAMSQGTQSAKSLNMDLDFTIITSNVATALMNDCSTVLAAPGNINLIAGATLGKLQIPTFGANPGPTVLADANPLDYPATYTGIEVTGITLNGPLVPIGLSGDTLSTEYTATLNIQAKKVVGGAALPGAQVYSKDFPIDVWVNTGTFLIQSCQQASVLANATLTIAPTSTCTSSDGGVITGTWSATGPAMSAFLASPQLPPAPPIALNSTNGNPFSVPAPATAGSYTFTLYVVGASGVPTTGRILPQIPQPIVVTVIPNGTPPCP